MRHTGGNCDCQPQRPKPLAYEAAWASPTRRVNASEAAAITNATHSGADMRSPALNAAPRVAYCVTGQARGLALPRDQHARAGQPGGSLFGAAAAVDVFAVLDAGCQPNLCLGDVDAKIASWLQLARPVRALTSGSAC